jgi:hypothetical protein
MERKHSLLCIKDGIDENSQSVLFGQRLVIGQSDCHRNDKVCTHIGETSRKEATILRVVEITFMCTITIPNVFPVRMMRNVPHGVSLDVYNDLDSRLNSETIV